MKKMLVTGGTVFVSRYIAEYYIRQGYKVYVLNRGTREQSVGVNLIRADRHNLGNTLQKHHFDVVVDTAYTADDVDLLLNGLSSYENYILISSSAVYPEYGIQPFRESDEVNVNKYWGKYGTDKIDAENTLIGRNPNAYILRPPYLYGQMNNIYRESFVFDCALQDRCFYLPNDGKMGLQFFHVEDLCRFIDVLLEKKPIQQIFNVGNSERVSVRQWVEICYSIVGKTVKFKNVYDEKDQRKYFSFYDYDYYLDVSKQHELMSKDKDLHKGLEEAFVWYKHNSDKVNKKPFIEYIDATFMGL